MLCLENEVLMLTDFFQTNIDNGREAFGFDQLHAYSTPNFT